MAQLKVADRPMERWIFLDGDLDQSDVLDVKAAFDEAVAGTGSDVVLDLGGLSFLGTLGIGLLASTQDRLETEGRALRLANVPEFIERTLRTMNLDEMFERA
jgi:anti-anti-sigma factor